MADSASHGTEPCTPSLHSLQLHSHQRGANALCDAAGPPMFASSSCDGGG